MLLPPITLDLIEALTALGPLALATIGIAVYGIFVFNFYRFLARKDIFKLDLDKYNHTTRPLVHKTFASILYVVKFLIVFPGFVFFWFVVLAFLLSLMARNQSVDSILLAAMGVVGSIRICAYYNQALSTDLAKILPFALLGITLIDRSLANIPTPSANLADAVERWETMVYYMAAVVILEMVMRILAGTRALIRRKVAARRARIEDGAAAVPAPETPGAANGAAYDPAEYADAEPVPHPVHASSQTSAAARGGAMAADFPPYHPPLLRDLSAVDATTGRRGRSGGGMYSSAVGRPTFSGRVRISGTKTNVVHDPEATMPWERNAQWRAARSDAAESAPASQPAAAVADASPAIPEDRAAKLDKSFEKLSKALSYGRDAAAAPQTPAETTDAPKP